MSATRIVSQDIKDATIANGDIADDAVDARVLDQTGVTAATYTYATVAVDVNGRITSASNGTTPIVSTNFVDNETPSGTINGSNDTFTLANTPVAGSVHLYKNGIRQRSGAGNDFTISTATITFLAGNIPQTNDILLADYRK